MDHHTVRYHLQLLLKQKQAFKFGSMCEGSIAERCGGSTGYMPM